MYIFVHITPGKGDAVLLTGGGGAGCFFLVVANCCHAVPNAFSLISQEVLLPLLYYSRRPFQGHGEGCWAFNSGGGWDIY